MDYVGLLSRILVPFTLNKTLFRNSGFIVKALVGLVSQKASGYISEDSVTTLWDKARSAIAHFTDKFHDKTPKRKRSHPVSEAF